MRKIALFATLILTSISGYASSWNVLDGYTTKSIYFFDYETVIKKNDSTTLWVKYVNDENSPDVDGSYSTAQKMTYFCKKRTSQVLAQSTYGKNQNFIKSYQGSATESEIFPDSIGEAIYKEVCAKDFPTANKQIQNNDVFEFTRRFFQYLKNEKNDPAPK